MAIIMTRVRQKQIADELSKAGLNVNDFEFKPIAEIFFTIIYKKEPDYNFQALTNNVIFTPGNGLSKTLKFNYSNFETTFKHITTWAKQLKAELDITNPWENVMDSERFQNTISDPKLLSPFSQPDKDFISEKLDQILLFVDNSREDYEVIKKDIHHLKELLSSTTITKKDWILLFVSTAVSGCWDNIFSIENISSIWNQLIHYFGDGLTQLMK